MELVKIPKTSCGDEKIGISLISPNDKCFFVDQSCISELTEVYKLLFMTVTMDPYLPYTTQDTAERRVVLSTSIMGIIQEVIVVRQHTMMMHSNCPILCVLKRLPSRQKFLEGLT